MFLSKTCWFFSLVWFFRQNLLNSRRKYFSSRQKCILSQNFSNFGETFQQNCQKGIYMSRGTLWQKQYDDFAKQIPTCFRQRNVGFFGGKFAAFLSNLHFCLRMGNWKNSFERIFIFFLIFFGRPGNIFCFFRCIIPGMVVQIEFHQPRGTYPLRKNLRENVRPFRTMSAVFWTFIEIF